MTSLAVNKNVSSSKVEPLGHLHLMGNPNYKSICKTARHYTKKTIENYKSEHFKINKNFKDYLNRFSNISIYSTFITPKFQEFISRKKLVVSIKEALEIIELFNKQPSLFNRYLKSYSHEQIEDFFKVLMYINLLIPYKEIDVSSMSSSD